MGLSLRSTNRVSSASRTSTNPVLFVRKLTALRKVAMIFLCGGFVLFCQGKVDKSRCQYIFEISFIKGFSCHFSCSFTAVDFKVEHILKAIKRWD